MSYEFLASLVSSQFSFSDFSFLNTEWYQWALRAIAVATAAGGSYFFLTAFMPAVKYFHASKNTAGISKLMFTLHATVACLFTISAILLSALACTIGLSFSNGVPHLLLLGVIFFFVNCSCWLGNSYIVKLKSENAKEAASMGMTEDEHYNRVILPRLNKGQ